MLCNKLWVSAAGGVRSDEHIREPPELLRRWASKLAVINIEHSPRDSPRFQRFQQLLSMSACKIK